MLGSPGLSDSGLTWSSEFDLNKLMPSNRSNMVEGEGPGALQLSLTHPQYPGRIIWIGHRWNPFQNESSVDTVEYAWWSDDGGKTFGFGESLGAHLNEATLVELADGSILVNLRPDAAAPGNGVRLTARSTDGGASFSKPKPDPALINGHCQASMLTENNGSTVLFSNPASTAGRMNGTLRISYDSAKTWSQEVALGLDPNAAFGYSCLTRVPNVTINDDRVRVGVLFETAASGCDGVSCQLRYHEYSSAMKADDEQAQTDKTSAFPTARPVGPTFEEDEIDLSNGRQWVAIESQSCLSFNSVDPFDEASARLPGRFSLAEQGRDRRRPSSQQLQPVDPATVSVRALLIFAPQQWDDLRVAYRAFIHLPHPLAEGTVYNLTALGLNASWNTAAVSRLVSFSGAALNTNIRLNQVGFLPQQPKRAWLGQYAGRGAGGTNVPVNFNTPAGPPTFEVLDDTGDGTNVVLSGTAKQSGAAQAFNLTGQQLWQLDFSQLTTPGWYRLRVAGVGVGHGFQSACTRPHAWPRSALSLSRLRG